jgi:hypothetical protein
MGCELASFGRQSPILWLALCLALAFNASHTISAYAAQQLCSKLSLLQGNIGRA